ncbi:hypothetical protein N309_07317, partial [Tinamus guttatus]
NGLKLCQGRFGLDIRKNFYMERGVKLWNKAVRPPSLAVFKKRIEEALRNMV